MKKARWYLNRLIDHVEKQIAKEQIEAVQYLNEYPQCASTNVSQNGDFKLDAYNCSKEESK